MLKLLGFLNVCFYLMPFKNVLIEYVTVLRGPTNATHNLSLSPPSFLPPLPSNLSPLFISFCCIPALMELQQEDKVVSKLFLCVSWDCLNTSMVHKMLRYA